MKNCVYIFILISSFLAGCASTPSVSYTKQDPQNNAKVDLINITELRSSNSESCPNNDKSWKTESLERLANYANACTQAAKFDRVEQIGSHLSQRHPTLPWGPFYMSVASEGKNEFTKAMWMIELSMKRWPNFALLHYQKGRILWKLGEYAKAMDSFNFAVKQNPKFTDAHLFLAQVHYRDQDYKLAHEHFSIVIKYESSNLLANLGLAETKMSLGDVNGAVKCFEQAINISPRNVHIKIRLAGVYETVLKDEELALSTYRRAREVSVEQKIKVEELPLDLSEKIKSLESRLVDRKLAEAKVNKQQDKKVHK